jgi:hypothetical protein
MTQGPRIYNLFPLLAGPLLRWGPHLERAARMAFTWIFVNPFHQAVSFPESHDTPRLAAELDGDRQAVLQRYAFGFLKATRDGREAVLVLLNLDRAAPVRVQLPSGIFPPGGLVLTDPTTARCEPLAVSGALGLEPSGIRIVFAAPPVDDGRSGAGAPPPAL